MIKRTRLLLLLACVAAFFLITPYIVLYSLGYRVDFRKEKITATGGIYTRVAPAPAEVIIDETIKNTTGIFSNAVFVQNLLPGMHQVLIKKYSYHSYAKSLIVKENEVTKLENVMLFKENIPFALIDSGVDYFSPSPNYTTLLVASTAQTGTEVKAINTATQQGKAFFLPNTGKISDIIWADDSSRTVLRIGSAYYLFDPSSKEKTIPPASFLSQIKSVRFNPQNSKEIFFIKGKNLYSNAQEQPIIKNVLAYQKRGQDIIYLSSDGFLYAMNSDNNTAEKLASKPITIGKNSLYSIIIAGDTIFIKSDNALLSLDAKEKVLYDFYSPVTNLVVSPDGQKIIYHNEHEILFSDITTDAGQKVFLHKLPETISGIYWLTNDYFVINAENNVIISETDWRGNVNAVPISQAITLPDATNLTIQNPLLSVDTQNHKLYALTQGHLIASEKLTP